MEYIEANGFIFPQHSVSSLQRLHPLTEAFTAGRSPSLPQTLTLSKAYTLDLFVQLSDPKPFPFPFFSLRPACCVNEASSEAPQCLPQPRWLFYLQQLTQPQGSNLPRAPSHMRWGRVNLD